MKKLALCISFLVCLGPFFIAAAQDGSDPSSGGSCATSACMTTWHNNNMRNGVNNHEKVLVASSFPSLSATQVNNLDGMIYAQPLYLSGVAWTGPTPTGCPAVIPPATKNVVYVATENNTVYAIDADNYGICTSVSLNSGTGDSAIPVRELPGQCNNISGSQTNGTIGVTGTPVIDPVNNTLFVVSAHKTGTATYTQRLNAISTTNLALLSSNLDLPSVINPPPTGSGYPIFYAIDESQRSGLLLTRSGSSGANIYVAWASFCDKNLTGSGYLNGSFGIISEFDFDYPSQTFSTSVASVYLQGKYTNSSWTPPAPAGVWGGGAAPAADLGGNVYLTVGNGNFEGVSSNGLNFGNSIVKLGGTTTWGVTDFYTPNDWVQLNMGGTVSCGSSCMITVPSDFDLGAGGVVVLTPSSSTAYGELIAGGKEGMFYVTSYCSSSTCPATGNNAWNQLMGGLDGGGYGTDTGSKLRERCLHAASANLHAANAGLQALPGLHSSVLLRREA